MRKIYRVWAESGAYSDHSEWTVAAFESEGVAEAYRKLAQEENDRIQAARWDNGGAVNDAIYAGQLKNAYDLGDSEFRMGEVTYHVEVLEARRTLPALRPMELPTK